MNGRINKFSTLCLLAVALSAVLQQGCQRLSALTSDNTAWEGHPIDDLIASWGQADKTEQLGTDYVAYTWANGAADCEHTFTVSDKRITGYSSSECAR